MCTRKDTHSWGTTGACHLLLLCPLHPPHTHPLPTLNNSEKEEEAKVEGYKFDVTALEESPQRGRVSQPFFLDAHSSSPLTPCKFIPVLFFTVI